MKYIITVLILIINLSILMPLNGIDVELTNAEQEYLNKLGTIKMGVDPDWYPIEFVDKNDNYSGIIPEMLLLLEDRLDIKFEIVPTKNWSESLAKSRENKVTLLPAINRTRYREGWLNFTDPIMFEPNVVITQKDFPQITDIAKLENAILVTTPDNMTDEWARRDFRNLNVIYRNTEKECLKAVADGDADFLIRSQLMASYLIKKEGYAGLIINNQIPGYSNNIRMGIIKSEPILVNILNKGIRSITFQEKNLIIEKFLEVNMEAPYNYPLIIFFVSLGVLITLILLYWNRKLKQLNKVIKAGEEKQRAIIAAIPDGLTISDLNGKITYASKESVKMWGYSSKSDILGKNILGLVHTSYHEMVLENIKLILQGNSTGFAEFKMIKRSGEIFYADANAEVIKDSNGKSYAILLVSRDVTEKKKTELKLKEAIDRYESIMNQSRSMNWEIDKNGLYTYISSNVNKILGYEQSEIVGKKHFYDIFPEDSRDELKKFVFEIMNNKKALASFENPILNQAGQKMWFLSSGLSRENEAGELIGYQGSNTDITLRKNAEIRVEFQNRYQRMVASISAQFMDVTLSNYQDKFRMMLGKLGKLIRASHTFILEFSDNRKYLEYAYEWCNDNEESTKNIIGKITIDEVPLFAKIVKDRDVLFISKLDDIQEDSNYKSFFNKICVKSILAIPIIRNDQFFGYFAFDSTTKSLFLPEEDVEILRIISNIIGDVYIRNSIETEKNRVQESLREATIQAQQANKAKSEFLANMSHEIRTPLNGVIGFTELLMNTELDSIQQQYAHHTNVSGQALLGIINDILDFSKIEAGKLELDIVETDINKLIEETMSILKYHAEKKDLKLLVYIDPKLPELFLIDPIRLKQVLINLLNNAIKFTSKGEVKLNVKFIPIAQNRGKLSFSVTDTGIGIPLNQQERLFSAFSQADGSITRRYGGTGLGLTISNLLVIKMGGKIEIESTEGVGSNFYFTIVANYKTVDAHYPKIKKNKLSTEGKSSSLEHKGHQKILIVEDVKMNLVLIKTIISKAMPQSEIITANNGEEGVDIFRNDKFDIVLMDVQMPVMDGLSATAMIRRLEKDKTHKTPIIALTAGTTKEETKRCLEAGMDDFITKPIDQNRLFDLLEIYLENKKS